MHLETTCIMLSVPASAGKTGPQPSSAYLPSVALPTGSKTGAQPLLQGRLAQARSAGRCGAQLVSWSDEDAAAARGCGAASSESVCAAIGPAEMTLLCCPAGPSVASSGGSASGCSGCTCRAATSATLAARWSVSAAVCKECAAATNARPRVVGDRLRAERHVALSSWSPVAVVLTRLDKVSSTSGLRLTAERGVSSTPVPAVCSGSRNLAWTAPMRTRRG